MFTATANLILPSTVTGSFPRPRWFDVSMWGRPLDTCMLDIRFREKFQDALAVVISDQERTGIDIFTHGDFHLEQLLVVGAVRADESVLREGLAPRLKEFLQG